MTIRKTLINKIHRDIMSLYAMTNNDLYEQRMTLMPRVESICAALLNLMFDYTLTAADLESLNTPVIDFWDQKHSIALEITASGTRAKINRIIEAFRVHRLHETYHTLIILIFTDKPVPALDTGAAGEGLHLQIMTLNDLLHVIDGLPQGKLQSIEAHLANELGSASEDHIPETPHKHLLPAAPDPVNSFVPHSRTKELRHIHISLRKWPLLFLSGMEGMGKTQLALQYAKDHAPDQGAYLLPYQQPSAPNDPIRETILYAAVGAYAPAAMGDNQRTEVFHRTVEILQREYTGALLIIDGFDPTDPAVSDSDYLSHFGSFADQTGIKLIITTRLNVRKNRVFVGPLQEIYSLQLMEHYGANKHFSQDRLQSVSEMSKNTPLIVDRIGRLMGRSPSRSESLTMIPSSAMAARESIPALFHDPLHALDADCRRVLTFAALLPEEGLEKTLFENALTDTGKRALRRLLREEWLEKLSTSTDPAEDDHSFLAIHPYIRKACLDTLTFSIKNQRAILELLWNYERSWRWDRIPLLEHANVKQRLAKIYAAAAKALHDHSGVFAQRSAELWRSANQVTDALYWQHKAIEAQEQRKSGAPWELARAYHFVGECYTQLQEHQLALQWWEKVLLLCKSSLQVSVPDLAAAHYHAGRAHFALGNYQEAAKQLEAARILQNDSLSTDHPLRKAVQEQLDNVYNELGQHRIALDYLYHDLSRESEARYLWLPLTSGVGLSSFIGRERELEEISTQLHSGRNPIVISGLPGSGKTELVLHFARNYRHGRVYYTRFDTSFRKTIVNLAASIRPPLTRAELSAPDEALYSLVMDILGNCTENDIFIIDDLPSDSHDVTAMLQEPAYRELTGLGLRMILTTRVMLPNSICVEALPYHDLFRIFEQHGVSLEESRMAALIDAVNGHTVTIDLIARMLANGGIAAASTEEMLKALHSSALPDDGSSDVSWLTQHLHTIFGIAQLSQAARNVLCCAALIPATGIQDDLFRKTLSIEERKILSDLDQRGWIRREQKMSTLHPVIRTTCIQELNPSDEICGPFLDALWTHCSSGKYDPKCLDQMAGVYAEAARILEDREARHILRAVEIWKDIDQHQKIKELYDRLLPKYERNLSPDAPVLARLYNEVGWAYSALGMYTNALEYTLKAISIMEEAPTEGPTHDNRLALTDAYSNVGAIYAAMGNYKIALTYQLKTLDLRISLLHPGDWRVASAFAAAGNTCNLAGDHEGALRYQKSALDIWNIILPPDHPQLAEALRIVGNTHRFLGKHRHAFDYLVRALTTYKQILPSEHPTLGAIHSDIGLACRGMGNYDLGLSYFEQALAIFQKAYPSGHPKILETENIIIQTRKQL